MPRRWMPWQLRPSQCPAILKRSGVELLLLVRRANDPTQGGKGATGTRPHTKTRVQTKTKTEKTRALRVQAA